MGDFNLALVIVAVVVCVLVFLFNVYLLVNYQHPDDVNQAYFPKAVVVFGLSIAAISILMLPADVANRQACRHALYNGACQLTLPMKDLWLAVYIADAILVFFVIPFAMFYYEGDQDKSVGKRLKSALMWVIASFVVCALVLGILYGVVGDVEFTVRHLSSTVTNLPTTWTSFTSGQPCVNSTSHQYGDQSERLLHVSIVPSIAEINGTVCNVGRTSFVGACSEDSEQKKLGTRNGEYRVRGYPNGDTFYGIPLYPFYKQDYISRKPNMQFIYMGSDGLTECLVVVCFQCSAYQASASSETTWKMKATFPEYVVALATIVGSVLFTVCIFGGVGIFCLPLGLIFSFIRRPKAVITRSQYIKEATELGKRARELKKAADALHQEERSGSKGRKWRKNVKAVEKVILHLMPLTLLYFSASFLLL
ncbi:hypothetical protein Taro_044881 [Colocasia esculenta]|uniref:LIMR family protein n=1 Tax=Colocasia esculenta TaxID=4460 RepID=A0A843X5X8_COLES|nr:hypothetical protein [Colocasia esculenta]